MQGGLPQSFLGLGLGLVVVDEGGDEMVVDEIGEVEVWVSVVWAWAPKEGEREDDAGIGSDA